MLHSRRYINMGEYFQSRGTTKWDEVHDKHDGDPPQNPLLLFCDLILKYEKYKQSTEEIDQHVYSSGSERTNDSFSSESEVHFNDTSYSSEDIHYNVENKEAWNLITCFCMKPYKGRPMIECNSCGTWLHMSCAKIKSKKVPDIFKCQFCQDANSRKRRSERIRSDDRRMSP